jgi:hypothetical protein
MSIRLLLEKMEEVAAHGHDPRQVLVPPELCSAGQGLETRVDSRRIALLGFFLRWPESILEQDRMGVRGPQVAGPTAP